MTKKIDRLRRELAEADMIVFDIETNDPCSYRVKEFDDREKIARKLQAATKRSNSPAPWFNPWVTLAIVVSLFLLAWIAGR